MHCGMRHVACGWKGNLFCIPVVCVAVVVVVAFSTLCHSYGQYQIFHLICTNTRWWNPTISQIIFNSIVFERATFNIQNMRMMYSVHWFHLVSVCDIVCIIWIVIHLRFKWHRSHSAVQCSVCRWSGSATHQNNPNRQAKASKNPCSTPRLEFKIKCRRFKHFQEMETNLRTVRWRLGKMFFVFLVALTILLWVSLLHFVPLIFGWAVWMAVCVCGCAVVLSASAVKSEAISRVVGVRNDRKQQQQEQLAKNRNKGNEYTVVAD